jgi:hypothetical protein
MKIMSSFLLLAVLALAFAVLMQKLMHFEAKYSSADIAILSAGLTVVITGANSGPFRSGRNRQSRCHGVSKCA